VKRSTISAALVILLALAACSEGGKFSARVLDFGLSPGGRWEVVIEVTNSGNEGVTPDCDITAIDADGIALAMDSVTLDPMPSGETTTTRVLTSLRPGNNAVKRWKVTCN
jgi:hypothetical protein